jgi:hypothetical protein
LNPKNPIRFFNKSSGALTSLKELPHSATESSHPPHFVGKMKSKMDFLTEHRFALKPCFKPTQDSIGLRQVQTPTDRAALFPMNFPRHAAALPEAMSLPPHQRRFIASGQIPCTAGGNSERRNDVREQQRKRF